MILLADRMGRIQENLRDPHWEIVLVQDMELWEVRLMVAPLVDFQVGMEITSLMSRDW